MDNQNAVANKGVFAELYDFTNKDLDSVKKRAAGAFGWSSIFGVALGLGLTTLGLLSSEIPLQGMGLVVLGVLALCEPQRTKTPRSVATVELINRLERRIEDLESRLRSES